MVWAASVVVYALISVFQFCFILVLFCNMCFNLLHFRRCSCISCHDLLCICRLMLSQIFQPWSRNFFDVGSRFSFVETCFLYGRIQLYMVWFISVTSICFNFSFVYLPLSVLAIIVVLFSICAAEDILAVESKQFSLYFIDFLLPCWTGFL